MNYNIIYYIVDTCSLTGSVMRAPWTNKYVVAHDTTNEMKKTTPNIKAKLSCFKCLAVSDLENGMNGLENCLQQICAIHTEISI